ncbi:MAG: ABC transporter ATP-binding protein [Planctomycetota bacterium]
MRTFRPFRDVDVPTLRRAITTFRPALKGQGSAVAGAVALTLGGTVLELLRPWPVQYLIDHVLIPGRYAVLPVALCCGAVLLLGLSIGQLVVARATLVARIARKVATRVRKRLFRHLHRLALPFHHSQRTGDLIVRLMGDVDLVRDLLFASWITMLGRGVVMVGAVGVMFWLDPLLAGLALLPLPLLVLGIRRSSRRLTGVTRKQRRKQGDAAAYAAETLRQIRLVKAYAAEDRATRVFADRTRASERAGGKAARVAAGMTRVAEICTGAGLALVLFAGVQRVQAGALSVGQLLVLLSYTRSLYKPVRKLAREGARLAKATACAGRVLEVLDLEPEDPELGRPVPRLRGAIDFCAVTFRYAAGQRALRGLTLHLDPGTLAVLSGPNGAGKSTVLGLLLRLFRPDEGEIRVDGLPIESLRLAEYRERIAYLPQGTLLFGATVRDNIAFGNPDATDEEIERAARLALAHDFVEGLSEGYDTVLGENGGTVSGGEAGRLMLARAAVRDANILLLDEPLAGLDPEARAFVAPAIRRIAAGRTTLVVHHGPAGELDADVHLHLEGGRLVGRDRVRQARA